MSSSNRRERELARAKRERQLASASKRASRKRNLTAFVIGALVLALGGFTLLSGALSDQQASPTTSPSASATPTISGLNCTEAPGAKQNPAQFTQPTGPKVSGKWDWTLNTNCGTIVAQLDADKAPATVRSFKFLTDNLWFNDVPCHRITTVGLFVLQCGDPSGTGGGGPGYTIPDENLPTPDNTGVADYPAGTIAMANAGANTGGSQFFIVYKDTQLGPNYTIFGTITSGLDIVTKIAAAGDVAAAGDGQPLQRVGILTATMKQVS